MKKSLIVLTLFFIFSNSLIADQIKLDKNFRGCKGEISKTFLYSNNQIPIKSIEIDTKDYRKWTINGVKILTSRYRYVEERYKRRFSAKVSVFYKDGTSCVFDARIRHSGDEKDHISLLGNSITQSLDIHLKNGNIRGITKFKLLRPKVRGVLEDEIFLTEVLRNLDYIAPRTIKVNTRVNNLKTTMLFQEKAAKEMLEFNNRREGPIFEGDERFFFKKVEKVQDNQLSNWSLGIVDLMNQNAQHMLAKQVNSEIVSKSQGHKLMSLNASSKLNLIYLYFANRFKDNLNNFNYMEYDLDNSLLALFDENKVLKLDEYKLLIEAVNGHHGLAVNNRKFFWNSIENYFEPINYDSNANISLDISRGQVRLPISNQFLNSFTSLKNKLTKLDLNYLEKKFQLSGIQITEQEILGKINKIIKNINQLEINYKNLDENLVEHNKFKSIEKLSNNFYNNIKKSNIDVMLIKYNQESTKFDKCKNFLENCEFFDISNEKLSLLLEGDLSVDNKSYQYLGANLDFDRFAYNNFDNFLVLNETKIFFNNGIEIRFDKPNNNIVINQKIAGAKVVFLEGKLQDTKIIYKGVTNISHNYSSTDINGLTGCLTFLNLELNNLIIEANGSSCEDSVNLVNVSGSLKNIIIQNSHSDALDVDFSNVKIDNLNILKAGNDCADFSYGTYDLTNLKLQNCGDKALSIGEKSLVKLNNISANNSITGIASKDSSLTTINRALFEHLHTCISAYNKKQEFDGSIIYLENFQCRDYKTKINKDSRSKIFESKKSHKN